MTLASLGRWLKRDGVTVLPSREAYALWAPRYPPHPHNVVMETEQAIVAPLIAAAAPVRALDVGTGSGRYLPLLARAGARTIVGIDLSMTMLSRGAVGVPVVCADACRLPFADASFDLVTGLLTVGDVANLEVWVAEIARVLVPGGRLVYSDFHPIWTSAGWKRSFTTDDGRTFAVSYHPHQLEDHATALQRCGFSIRTLYEPSVNVPHRWPRRARKVPALVIVHAEKSNGRPDPIA